MKLKDYLFDGGNPEKWGVRFVLWFGGGDCPYCAFYRLAAAYFVSVSALVSGWQGVAGAVTLIGILALALWHKARNLPEPLWRDR